MSWKGRHVLVTGAGGFIGSHLVEALVDRGAKVTAMVRYNSRNDCGKLRELPALVVKRIAIQAGDITDYNSLEKLVRSHDAVFHLAALIAIPYSYRAAHSFVTTNVVGTLNVLEACRKHKIEKLVHTSSSEVYGTARYVPIDENHPLQAQSPYAASKIAADKLAESYYRSFDLPVVTVRPFNTFGPRQSLRAVIPSLITQALSNGSILRIGSPDPIRDFTFVHDTARGFILAAESDKAVGDVVNIGTGGGHSISKVVQDVLRLTGQERAKVTSETRRLRPDTSEVLKLVCSAKKAQRILGWRPAISFEEGLQLTIDYFRKNPPDHSPAEYVV